MPSIDLNNMICILSKKKKIVMEELELSAFSRFKIFGVVCRRHKPDAWYLD